MSSTTHENIHTGTLWFGIIASPVAWAIHFAGAWLTTEMGCAFGLDETNFFGLNGILMSILILTVVTLPVAIYAGAIAYLNRQRVIPSESINNDLNDSGQWQRFMTVLGLLNSVVFSIAIIVETIPIFVLPLCS